MPGKTPGPKKSRTTYPYNYYPDGYVLDSENRPVRRCMEVVRVAGPGRKPPKGLTEFEQVITTRGGKRVRKTFWIGCKQVGKKCPRGTAPQIVNITVRFPNGSTATDFKCRCQKPKQGR